MNIRPDPVRLRFWLWTAAMVALALGYETWVAPALRIDTDLVALLPPSEQGHGPGAAAVAAQARYGDSLSRKLVFLVGAAEPDAARRAAARFAATLRASKAFASVMLEADAMAPDFALYTAHRFGLLAASQRRLLRAGQGEQLVAQALRDVYGPGAQPRALSVSRDPFNLLGTFLLQQSAGLGAVRPQGGMLMLEKGGTSFVLIAADIGQEPFSVATQDRVIPIVDAAIAQARGSGASVLTSGVILHAAEAARRARREITRVGTLSVAGIALMILLTFHSLRPLLLSVLVLGSGALAALTVCHLVFGSVTLIALVFGTGLIGVAVDYSTHFLADQFRNPAGWTPRQALDHVGPAIAMGMGCAVLGYLSLGLTPLPGLRQMAVFSAAGLVVACVGVLCWYPLLATRARRGEPRPLRWALTLDRGVGRIAGRRARVASVVLGALALLGLARVEFADDIRLLNTPAPALLESDSRLRSLLQGAPDSQFFLVQGSSPAEVLEREERLRDTLDAQVEKGSLDTYRAISRALPSPHRQSDDRALLAQVYGPAGAGTRLMDALGFSPAMIAQRRLELAGAPAPLGIDEWLAAGASAPYRDLWLGPVDHGYASIVSLGGIRDFAALQALASGSSGVLFVDRVSEVSGLLGRYRELALLLLAAAYLLVGLAMAFRYGPADAARLLSVPLGAALLTAALLGACGSALNLFHVLGLFVVLGLGVDYAVFLREGAGSRAATVLAISLSTVGAVLSYGLLAFSATPFIRAIGLTVLSGVGFTYLLALLSQRPAPEAIPAAPAPTAAPSPGGTA